MEDTDVVGDATFCKAFDGYVGVGRLVDTETGRYYGMVDYSVVTTRKPTSTTTMCSDSKS